MASTSERFSHHTSEEQNHALVLVWLLHLRQRPRSALVPVRQPGIDQMVVQLDTTTRSVDTYV
jgi:hypothetical protein